MSNLEKHLAELMGELEEHGDLAAWIASDGIRVEVRGDITVGRTFPLREVARSAANPLTMFLNRWRAEAGL